MVVGWVGSGWGGHTNDTMKYSTHQHPNTPTPQHPNTPTHQHSRSLTPTPLAAHSSTRPLVHSSTRSLVHSFIRSRVRSLAHLVAYDGSCYHISVGTPTTGSHRPVCAPWVSATHTWRPCCPLTTRHAHHQGQWLSSTSTFSTRTDRRHLSTTMASNGSNGHTLPQLPELLGTKQPRCVPSPTRPTDGCLRGVRGRRRAACRAAALLCCQF